MLKISDPIRLAFCGREIALVPAGAAYTVPSDALAAVWTAPRRGGRVRAELPGDAFSADVLLAAAYAAATLRGETRRYVELAECSGVQTVLPVLVTPESGVVSAALPVPELSRADGALIARFPGVTCCAAGSGARAFAAAEETPGAALAVQCDDVCAAVRVWARASAYAPWTSLPGSALAAATAAVYRSAKLPDGVSERGVGLPGGAMEVGVRMERGALTGLSVMGVIAPVNAKERSADT